MVHIAEEKTRSPKKWNRGQWEVFIFTNKNCALNYRNQPHFEIPKGEQTLQKLDFERRHCKNIVVSFTTLVRVFFTGTDFGVDICFGSGLDNLKLCFKGWLSFFTGLSCSAGFSASFRNSRFLWSILMSELDFTPWDVTDRLSIQAPIY